MWILLAFVIWRAPLKTRCFYCDPTGGVLTAAIVIGAGAAKSYSEVKQGQAQKKYYDSLADNARAQGEAQLAVDTKKSEIEQDVGSQQVKAEAIKGAELQAQQTAIQAANGVSGSGSAQDIAIDTMRKVKDNEVNLKYNADTKSWALDTEGKYAQWSANEQSAQYKKAGKNALSAAKRQVAVTMLQSASTAAMV